MAQFEQPSDRNSSAKSREYSASGVGHLQKGAYEDAIREFGEAIQLDPTNVEAYQQRGVAHLKKGDCELAVRDFTEAIRLDPTNIDAYRGRWLAYRSLDDDANAVADKRALDALGGDPKPTQDVWSLIQDGNSHKSQGELDKAMRCYAEAIRRNPKDICAYTYRALLHEQMGNPAAATADWEEAVRLYSDGTATASWPYFATTLPYRLLRQKAEQSLHVNANQQSMTTQPVGADVMELLGTWEVLEGHFLGEALPPKMCLIIDGTDKVTWQFDVGKGEESHDQACRVDAARDPKGFDLGLPDDPKNLVPGIFKIERERLTILIGTQTDGGSVVRPKGFDDSAMAHYVFKRISGLPRQHSRGKRWWQLWK